MAAASSSTLNQLLPPARGAPARPHGKTRATPGKGHLGNANDIAKWRQAPEALAYDGDMLLQAAILTVGLLVGWGLGGGLRGLRHVRLRIWPVAPAALALQLAPAEALAAVGATGERGELGALLLSYLLLLLVAAVNWRHPGFPLIVIGLALNVTVMSVNGGMPVSEAALHRAGRSADIRILSEGVGPKHHLATGEDRLMPLADVIPVAPPFSLVLSVGDVLTYTGAAVFLAGAMLARSPRQRDATARPPAPTATTWGTLP